VDVLWFYFGYSAFFTLTDDNNWSPDRAERWLYESACQALLTSAPAGSGAVSRSL
jgi:hypothetical protein